MTASAPRVRTPDRDVLALIAGMAGAPPMETLPLDEARAAMIAALPMLCPDMPACDEARIQLGGVPVRSYRPVGSAGQMLPALLFFHGGGWVMGEMDAYAPLCAAFAVESNICVLSVDYRLAPEHPFPAGFDDAWSTAAALDSNAADLGIDGDRIAVGGDSAGGNLAAALCLARRDAGKAPHRLQLLLYPVLDARMGHVSYREFGEGWFLTASMMRWFRHLYLGADGSITDVRVSPLLANSMADLPAAHIVTCGLDPLQDEGRAFGDRLEHAGIEVRRHFHPDQIHGFLFMARAIPAAKTAITDIALALDHALHR